MARLAPVHTSTLAECLRSDPTDANRVGFDVRSLLTATGLRPATALQQLWAQAIEDEPTSQIWAKRFRALAGAPDPLAEGWRNPELWSRLRPLARSRGLLGRWQDRGSSLGRLHGPDWADLPPKEQQEVRALARHLARYHTGLVRRGRAKQGALDTALSGLAEIYVSHTGLQKHPHELPHAEASLFIDFCATALALGLVPVSSRTPQALSRRWKRLKELHRHGLPVKGPLKRRRRALSSAPLRRK